MNDFLICHSIFAPLYRKLIIIMINDNNNVAHRHLGPYSPTILKNILCLCLQELQI